MNMKAVSQGCTAVLLVSAATLSMGAQSCAKSVPSARVLKLDVEVGAVAAYPIKGPSGEVINFPFIANSLFYQRVMMSNNYVITNPIPLPNGGNINTVMGSSKTIAQKIAEGTAAKGDGELDSDDIKLMSDFGYFKSAASSSKAGINGKAVLAQSATTTPIPACLYNTPIAAISGSVVSFELTNSAGIGIGYGIGGAVSGAQISGNFAFSQSKLDVTVRMDDPLTQQVLAPAEATASQNKFNVGIGLPVGITLGLDFMFQTPIANVVRSAFDKGIKQISTTYGTLMAPTTKSWNDAWESVVVSDPNVDNDTHVMIRTGLRAGVQVGDQFTITNQGYKWTGAPCSSPLDYKFSLTDAPIALATVTVVSKNVSVAEVRFLQDQNIKPGALVKIYKLVDPTVAPVASPTPAPLQQVSN